MQEVIYINLQVNYQIIVQSPTRTPPSLLYNGYRVFPGGKAAGRGADHPPPSSAEVKKDHLKPVMGVLYLFTYQNTVSPDKCIPRSSHEIRDNLHIHKT
jgi:hypothetical protein